MLLKKAKTHTPAPLRRLGLSALGKYIFGGALAGLWVIFISVGVVANVYYTAPQTPEKQAKASIKPDPKKLKPPPQNPPDKLNIYLNHLKENAEWNSSYPEIVMSWRVDKIVPTFWEEENGVSSRGEVCKLYKNIECMRVVIWLSKEELESRLSKDRAICAAYPEITCDLN